MIIAVTYGRCCCAPKGPTTAAATGFVGVSKVATGGPTNREVEPIVQVTSRLRGGRALLP